MRIIERAQLRLNGYRDDQNHSHIDCPSLIIWGKSYTGKVYGDLLKIWRDYVSAELIGENSIVGIQAGEVQRNRDLSVRHFTE